MYAKTKSILIILVIWLLIIACGIEAITGGGSSESNNLALTVTANAILLQEAQEKAQSSSMQTQPQVTTPPEEDTSIVIAPTEIPPTRGVPRSKEEIEALSDQFDSVYLRDTWTIYRPLLGKYDLESRRGWLHIVGQKKLTEGYNNVFAQRVTSEDVVVTVKIGGTFTEPTQGAWLAFSPSEYKDNSRTVAVAVDSYGFGYRVMMWECREEKLCVETSMLGQNKFKYPGYVFLRLERRGKDYIGHYSVDGKQWIFIGQTNNFPVITDQVILGAGCMTCKNDFDIFFDFIEFKVR